MGTAFLPGGDTEAHPLQLGAPTRRAAHPDRSQPTRVPTQSETIIATCIITNGHTPFLLAHARAAFSGNCWTAQKKRVVAPWNVGEGSSVPVHLALIMRALILSLLTRATVAHRLARSPCHLRPP